MHMSSKALSTKAQYHNSQLSPLYSKPVIRNTPSMNSKTILKCSQGKDSSRFLASSLHISPILTLITPYIFLWLMIALMAPFNNTLSLEKVSLTHI